jgi:ATP-binding cassette subfamily F protein 3
VSVVEALEVSKAFGAHPVLEGVSLRLAWGDRAGLVGPNGAGKTTLLRLLAGREAPDRGRIAVARGARVGYLEQDPPLPGDRTVREAALEAFAALEQLEARLTALAAALAAGAASPELLREYGELQARFEQAGGYAREHLAEATLAGLGLGPELWPVPVRHLSGGQRVRLALARLLLAEPDLLLCDEPTNHLDAEAVEWLEQRLVRWKGALLVVSHDRYFLDRVCNRILELDAGRLTAYAGGYTAYVRQRTEALARAAEEQARAAQEEERLEAFVQRYRAGNRARQARSRLHRLERLRAEHAPVRTSAWSPTAEGGPGAGPRLRLEPRAATGREVLSVEGLAKAYGPKVLFGPWDAVVERGERVGIVGPNGAGKTTLLRLLAGQEPPDAGGAYWGRGVLVSWLRQDLGGLDDEATVLDNVLQARPDLGAAEARRLLARFLFRGEAVFRRAGDLSGGERTRLLLCLLSLEQGNVLLCDEPTNHLDVPAREALQEALEAFSGTLLLVSHDRYLLERLCTRIWWLHDGRVDDIRGGYGEYLARREAWRQAEATRRATERSEREPARPDRGERRRVAEQRRRAAELQAVEARIRSAEAELAALGERLGRPELYRDGQEAARAVAAYRAAEAALQALYAEWERLVGG